MLLNRSALRNRLFFYVDFSIKDQQADQNGKDAEEECFFRRIKEAGEEHCERTLQKLARDKIPQRDICRGGDRSGLQDDGKAAEAADKGYERKCSIGRERGGSGAA